jgi:hypothetical protein
MGQFKPMVKMETTEPSVILKLKKGGHVASPAKDENGHTNMKGDSFKAKYAEEAAEGEAPCKPSASDRRKAMSASLMKKGGKVEKKAMGGMMGAAPMAAPGAMGAAPTDPRKAAMLRALMARRGAGAAPAAPMAAPAAPMSAMKKGGKASDKAEDKAMLAKAMKQHDVQQHEGSKGTKLKLATGGLTNPMKKGGSTSGFADTKTAKMVTSKGYQKYATGGTITGNAGKFLNTNVDDKKEKPGYERYATGGVVNGFATGGLTNPMKKGGAAKKHFATGGSVDTGRAVAMPKRPVSKPISNTAQAGTFKKGGVVGDDSLTDASKGAYDEALKPDQGDMETAQSLRDLPGRAFSGMKRLLGFGSDAGAGRGVVNPPMARKQGGRAK